MAHSYNYAVLQAVPDPRRGERVNIGIVVFGPEGLDVRVCESRKLSALTGRSWDGDIKAFGEIIGKLDDPNLESEQRRESLLSVQDQLTVSASGWFEARNIKQYDKAVRDLLNTLVKRPKRQKHIDGPSVVSEISSVLRTAKLLATPKDRLDSGLVFRNFRVDDGLEADFAQKNGRYHVATVLDLRANNPQIAQAALKAIVLDRAEKKFGRDQVHKVGIFSAAKERLSELHDNLAILRPYADEVWNWEDPLQRRHVRRMFASTAHEHQGETLLN
jgi:hypothetical protein